MEQCLLGAQEATKDTSNTFQTLVEKYHLGDWSPEKDFSQDSNHPNDLFQYVTPGFKPFNFLNNFQLHPLNGPCRKVHIQPM